MKKLGSWKWVVVLGLAGSVLVLGKVLPIRETLVDLLDSIRSLGFWGPVVLALLYIPACLLFVPGSILTLGAGFAFGVWTGTVAVSVGSVLGAVAAFLAGRRWVRGWVEKKVAGDERFRSIDQAVRREGFKIVFLLRLSPLFPFNLLNYSLGLSAVSLRDYFLASWIGMLPGTVMYVYLGSAARNLADLTSGRLPSSPARMVLFAVGLAATIAVALVVARLARRSLKSSVPEAEKIP